MAAIRPIHYQRLVRVFEREGFLHDRQVGDRPHRHKSGVRRPIVIPMYREIPTFIIKNLLPISGMSREPYFGLLKD